MSATLTIPTQELVRAACETFDRDNPVVEPALTELFSQYHGNTDIRHALLKVVALNALYSTQIFIYSEKVPNVVDVARHIQQNGHYIDSA
jgi:hypothetical protein